MSDRRGERRRRSATGGRPADRITSEERREALAARLSGIPVEALGPGARAAAAYLDSGELPSPLYREPGSGAAQALGERSGR